MVCQKLHFVEGELFGVAPEMRMSGLLIPDIIVNVPQRFL